jgi:hypothetical protein
MGVTIQTGLYGAFLNLYGGGKANNIFTAGDFEGLGGEGYAVLDFTPISGSKTAYSSIHSRLHRRARGAPRRAALFWMLAVCSCWLYIPSPIKLNPDRQHGATTPTPPTIPIQGCS